ncbi:E3 ubiquitin-protein ligase TRIM7-like [Rhineura floridana]|uniref:E3 ubiquitin-protein ligase TRIM7-like n=1 Tax=Rhineura floridana TaxID=261503 RepID=UPI002AC84D2A|nr:E3 ubiquitin-protein ligase TRIM7-like [Rhineura floridana]
MRTQTWCVLQRPDVAMAEAADLVQDLCAEATCSICLEYFKDPVTIPQCGHNFCRSCLSWSWGQGTQASCPHCRATVQQMNLVSNRHLANFVEITRKLSLQTEKEGQGRVCEKHHQSLKLFCKDHEAPICLVCDKSKEHENHKVIPREEAFQEYKELICDCLEILRKRREIIMADEANSEKESHQLLVRINKTERQKAVDAFRRLRQFIEEQEKRLLKEIEEVEKEIARTRKKHLGRVCRELSSLESIIQEMEEKRQQPAGELLQDVKCTLQRYEKSKTSEGPVLFPPELRWRIWDLSDANLSLESIIKHIKDTVLFGEQLQKANVTLDPDTANRRLFLSENRRIVRCEDKWQAPLDNPERFNYLPAVLGCKGFTGGRHFWEVIVGSEGEWAVGVARKSVRRKDISAARPEEGIWAVGKCASNYRAINPPAYCVLRLGGQLNRIRVTINYERGQVSFSNADTTVLLYTFPEVSFFGETLLPFFSLWRNKTYLTIA